MILIKLKNKQGDKHTIIHIYIKHIRHAFVELLSFEVDEPAGQHEVELKLKINK